MEIDESWSAWQILGNPAQIIAWTPFDWPPRLVPNDGRVAGAGWPEPIILRLLPLYVFLLGMAWLYQLGRKLFGTAPALLSVPVCAAFAESIHLRTLLRGYVFVMALTPLALWLAVRYFACSTLYRAVLLAVSLAAMLYMHALAVFTIAAIGLYTLIVHPANYGTGSRPA
jgi:hypothetical protein